MANVNEKMLKKSSAPVGGFSISKVLIHSILILWSVTTMYALFWVINNSFKDPSMILTDSFAIATTPTLANYVNAFTKMNIGRAYLNSFIISGSVVIGVMFFGGLAAYVLARYTFKGKKLILGAMYGALLFPAFATIVPVYMMLIKFQLTNTYPGIILPQVAGNLAFAMTILVGFMASIPMELEEAAVVEGCGPWQIFTRIVIPISKPSFATVGIFTFLWSYNDLFMQQMIMRKPEMMPICALLGKISSQFGTDYGLMAAAVTLVVVPVLIVYLFLQKYIVKGLTAGAVKG
ncbi:MAG: carbohydrate ABC transporter permease [Cellulosilyticaceae bacterium]